MNQKFYMLATLILFFTVSATSELVEAAEKKAKERLAVLDLDAKHGIEKSFAQALSVIVRDKLHSFGEYQVMSTEDIKQVASREQLLQAMGCDDGTSQCLVDFGRKIESRFMVAGDISKIGSTYTVSLRMLDTKGDRAGVTNRVNESCKCDDDSLIGTVQDVAAKLVGKPTSVATRKVEEGKKNSEELEIQHKAEEEKQQLIAEIEKLTKEKSITVAINEKTSTNASTRPKTLVFCSEGSPEGFNPALYTAGTTFDASSRQIFDKLAHFKRGTTEIQPGLAEKWDVSADGLEYIFHLRKGVKFHTTANFTPNREFNTDDVMFTFMRQFDKSHPYHKVGGASYEYFNSMSMHNILKSIIKIDDYTVKFVLKRPEAPLIANLAMDFSSIFSAEFADKMMKAGTPEKVDSEPVGTGPFQLVAYQKDTSIRYQANPHYWAGKAPVDNLIFAITPDASIRYQKLKAGECHVMSYPNAADLKAMGKDPSVNLLQQEGLNIGYLAYNTQIPPFDKPKVRKSLNMAINKQAILDTVFQGVGKLAKNPIPPTIWAYNEGVVDDPYNPALAKQTLADVGVKDLKMKIWAMPVQRPYNPNAKRMAEMIQADFAQIGVTVEIVSYEWAEYLKRSKDKYRDGAVLLGWTGDNGDPDNFLAVLLGCDGVGGANRAQWCHQPFEDLIKKAKAVADPSERTKLYGEAQVVFKDQAPWATIAHSVIFQPVRKEVVDFRIDPFGGNVFYGVDLK